MTREMEHGVTEAPTRRRRKIRPHGWIWPGRSKCSRYRGALVVSFEKSARRSGLTKSQRETVI